MPGRPADTSPERRRPAAPQQLLLRTVSTLVMAPLALLSAWYGGWWFAAPLAAIGLYGIFEWNRMAGVSSPAILIISGAALAAGCWVLINMSGLMGLAVLAACAALTGLLALRRGPAVWPPAGLIYLGGAVLSLLWIRETQGPLATFWVLFLVWASDIGAYITGSLLGGPKLAPRLSPSKTWSGLIGGSFTAALVSAVFGVLAGLGGAVELGAAGLILACWSQLGDIVESTIKRRFKVKDSGRLIPGHGGVLDRIDSLAFTAPLIAIALYLSGWLGASLYG